MGSTPLNGLVEHQQARAGDERPRDRQTALLSAAQSQRQIARDVRDAKLFKQVIATRLPLLAVKRQGFEDREQILFDGQLAEDGFFLRQIAHAQAGAAVHRQPRHVDAVERDPAGVRRHQTDDHVKTGRLARPVRSQQPNDLAPADVDVHLVDHRAFLVDFDQPLRVEDLFANRKTRGAGGRCRLGRHDGGRRLGEKFGKIAHGRLQPWGVPRGRALPPDFGLPPAWFDVSSFCCCLITVRLGPTVNMLLSLCSVITVDGDVAT